VADVGADKEGDPEVVEGRLIKSLIRAEEERRSLFVLTVVVLKPSEEP